MSIKTILQGKGLPHPLHPILVHIPIGLWVGSFVFDVISMVTADPTVGHAFVVASFYCLLVGVIGAGLAALAGLADFLDIPRGTIQNNIAVSHMVLNVLLLVGYITQLVLRDTQAASVSVGLLVFNGIEVIFLSISGYLGARLVFQYRVGNRFAGRVEDRPRRVA